MNFCGNDEIVRRRLFNLKMLIEQIKMKGVEFRNHFLYSFECISYIPVFFASQP
jgi:hypothetical protein